MSNDDEVIRSWIARALGNLRPQAAAVIPALERAFKEARAAEPPYGRRTGIQLDDAIQQAMTKISEKKK